MLIGWTGKMLSSHHAYSLASIKYTVPLLNCKMKPLSVHVSHQTPLPVRAQPSDRLVLVKQTFLVLP